MWQELIDRFENGTLQEYELIPSSTKAVVICTYLPELDKLIYLKKLLPRNIFDRVKHLFGRVRATRARHGSDILHERGFFVPEFLCAEPTKSRQASYLITVAVEESSTVIQLLSPERLSKSQRIRLIREFARTVAELHENGIYHGDMQTKNILCRLKDFRFYWLDNERTNWYARLPLTRRMRNLRQLQKAKAGMSNYESRIFWNEYTKCSHLSNIDRRDLLKMVLFRRHRSKVIFFKVPDRLTWKCLRDDIFLRSYLTRT